MPKSPTLYTPTGQCCELDEPYQAPPGYFDQPFFYVYDADLLPDGQDRRRQIVTTYTGSDFILRRVAGIDRVCTQFQLRDVLSRLVFDTEVSTTFNDFPILPEMIWPGGTDISFDLINVQKVLSDEGFGATPLSQIVFQGVRRFKGYRRPPSYPYWEDPFTYVTGQGGVPPIDIDWGPTDPPHRYAINIYDYDFELLRILEFIDLAGGQPGDLTALKLQLYDQVNEEVFQAPVIDDLIMDNSTGYQGIVPVPGIVYRIGQAIRFDVSSLYVPPAISGSLIPLNVQLAFQGVRRRPC